MKTFALAMKTHSYPEKNVDKSRQNRYSITKNTFGGVNMNFDRVPQDVKDAFDNLPNDAQVCLLYLVKELVKLKKQVLKGSVDRIARMQ